MPESSTSSRRCNHCLDKILGDVVGREFDAAIRKVHEVTDRPDDYQVLRYELMGWCWDENGATTNVGAQKSIHMGMDLFERLSYHLNNLDLMSTHSKECTCHTQT